MQKKNKSLIVCLLVLLFSFTLGFKSIYASSKDLLNKIDFTISYNDGENRVKGAEFLIYKIGSFNENNEINLNNNFKNYPIDIKKTNKSYWNDYANTLKGYVKRDNIKADYKGVTDKNGLLNLKVDKGLYLIIGEDLIVGEYKFKTSPFIIMLPELDNETGKYLEKSIAYPKLIKEKLPKKKIEIKVLKSWNDKGYDSNRPNYIEVELVEDGKVKDTVRLNRQNNWSYTWKKLDPNKSYSVVEKNVDKEKYKVVIENYGNSFIITNTYIPPQSPPVKPPYRPQDPPNIPPKKPPMIPQTGQLWWPVYLLSGIGIISIFLGYIKEKRKGGINEKKNK